MSLTQLWTGEREEWAKRVVKARNDKYATGVANKQKLKKNELLIYGFIRDIQNCILSEKIIPSSINSIFLKFYHIPLENKEKIEPRAVGRMVKVEVRDFDDMIYFQVVQMVMMYFHGMCHLKDQRILHIKEANLFWILYFQWNILMITIQDIHSNHQK